MPASSERPLIQDGYNANVARTEMRRGNGLRQLLGCDQGFGFFSGQNSDDVVVGEIGGPLG